MLTPPTTTDDRITEDALRFFAERLNASVAALVHAGHSIDEPSIRRDCARRDRAIELAAELRVSRAANEDRKAES